mgnify:CR=1 FL=1
MTVVPFSSTFITQYSDAFNELLRLGTLSSQKKVEGEESISSDETASRMLTILQALDSPDLTEAEIEALEYCLLRLNESLVTPTVVSLLPPELVPGEIVDLLTFEVGTGSDVVDSFGEGSDVIDSIGS